MRRIAGTPNFGVRQDSGKVLLRDGGTGLLSESAIRRCPGNDPAHFNPSSVDEGKEDRDESRGRP